MSISSRAALLSSASSGEVTQALAQRFGAPTECPALRKDLIIRHLIHAGESKWVVKNPETFRLYTYNDSEWELIALFDGTRTPGEIRDDYNRMNPADLIEVTLVLDFKENLEEMGLLTQSGSERSVAVMQRLRDARKLKAEEKQKSFNIFLMLFPIADPNEFLNKTVKYVRWIWSPDFVAVGLVLFALTTAVFIRDFHQIWQQTLELYSFIGKPVIDVLEFYVIITLIASFHELGHAYAMKIYGGDVHSIGFALFFFLPAYFTDTVDSELLESKWQRLWINLGGIYIESFICVLTTAVWVVTYPDTFLHDIAYKGMIYTGVSTVMFNVNPLTPTDGYHALEDLLEIPELRPQSFQYIGALIQKYLFRLPVEIPPLSKRKRRAFLIYGPLSIVYTGTIMLAIFALVNHIYGFFLGELATPLAILTAIRMFRKRLSKFTDVLRMFYLDKKEYFMSRKGQIRLAALGAAAALAIFLPWPHEVFESPVVLKAGSEARIEVPADAAVESVDVREGQKVAPGTQLARLSSSDVAEKSREIEAVKGSYEARARMGRAAASAGDSAEFESRAEAASAALKVNRAVEAALVLRTPVAGTVLTHRPQDLVGSTVVSGSRFLTIGETSSMRIEIPVTERLLDSMRQGEPVSLRVAAQPFRTYRAKLSKISSAAQSFSETGAADAAIRPGEKPGRFLAIVRVDNPDGSLAPGMAGIAKLQGRRLPYAVQWWRVFYNWVRRIVW